MLLFVFVVMALPVEGQEPAAPSVAPNRGQSYLPRSSRTQNYYEPRDTSNGQQYSRYQTELSQPSALYPQGSPRFDSFSNVMTPPATFEFSEMSKRLDIGRKAFAIYHNRSEMDPIARRHSDMKLELLAVTYKAHPDWDQAAHEKFATNVADSWLKMANTYSKDMLSSEVVAKANHEFYQYLNWVKDGAKSDTPEGKKFKEFMDTVKKGVDLKNGKTPSISDWKFYLETIPPYMAYKNVRDQYERDSTKSHTTEAEGYGIDFGITKDRDKLDWQPSDFDFRLAEWFSRDARAAESAKRITGNVTRNSDFYKLSGKEILGRNQDIDREFQQTLRVTNLEKAVATLEHTVGNHSVAIEALAQDQQAIRETQKVQGQALNDLNAKYDELKAKVAALEAAANDKQGKMVSKELTEQEKRELREKIDAKYQPWIMGANFASSLFRDPKMRQDAKIISTVISNIALLEQVSAGAMNPFSAAIQMNMNMFALAQDDPQAALDRRFNELKDFMEDMYRVMMKEFAGLREQLSKMHRALDAQMDVMAREFRENLAFQRSLINEGNGGITRLYTQAQNNHLKERLERYDGLRKDLRKHDDVFVRPVSGKNALTDSEAKSAFKHFLEAATLDAYKSTLTGQPPVDLVGRPEDPAFCSALASNFPSYCRTSDLIQPFQMACKRMGNSICSGELPNELFWMEYSDRYASFAAQRPNSYANSHQSAEVANGQTIKTLDHQGLRHLIDTGTTLQGAAHALVWSHPDETSAELNRGFVDRIANIYGRRLDDVGTTLRGAQVEQLGEMLGLEELAKGEKGLLSAIARKIADEISICSDFDIRTLTFVPHKLQKHGVNEDKSPPTLKLTAEQKIRLAATLPKTTLLKVLKEKGTVDFCITDGEGWGDGERAVLGETPGRNGRYDDEPWVKTFQDSGKLKFTLRAKVGIKSDSFPVFEQVITSPKRLKLNTFIQYSSFSNYPEGSTQSADRGYSGEKPGHAMPWPRELERQWKSGYLLGLLEAGYGVEKHPEYVAQSADYLRKDYESWRDGKVEEYLKQKDAALKSPQLFHDLTALEGTRQFLTRVIEFGYPTLPTRSAKFRDALAQLDGMDSIAFDLISKGDALQNPAQLAEFINERKKSVIKLKEAFHEGLRELELDSIKRFTALNPSLSRDELLKKYKSEYQKRSDVGALGHRGEIDGQVAELSRFYKKVAPGATLTDGQRTMAKLENTITPSSVWKEGAKVPTSIEPCFAKITDPEGKIVDVGEFGKKRSLPSEALVTLSSEESTAIYSEVAKKATDEEFLAMEIGALNLGVCWVRSSSQPRRIELKISLGGDKASLNPQNHDAGSFEALEFSRGGAQISMRLTRPSRASQSSESFPDLSSAIQDWSEAMRADESKRTEATAALSKKLSLIAGRPVRMAVDLSFVDRQSDPPVGQALKKALEFSPVFSAHSMLLSEKEAAFVAKGEPIEITLNAFEDNPARRFAMSDDLISPKTTRVDRLTLRNGNAVLVPYHSSPDTGVSNWLSVAVLGTDLTPPKAVPHLTVEDVRQMSAPHEARYVWMTGKKEDSNGILPEAFVEVIYEKRLADGTLLRRSQPLLKGEPQPQKWGDLVRVDEKPITWDFYKEIDDTAASREKELSQWLAEGKIQEPLVNQFRQQIALARKLREGAPSNASREHRASYEAYKMAHSIANPGPPGPRLVGLPVVDTKEAAAVEAKYLLALDYLTAGYEEYQRTLDKMDEVYLAARKQASEKK